MALKCRAYSIPPAIACEQSRNERNIVSRTAGRGKKRVSISMVDHQRSPKKRAWSLTSIVFDPTQDIGKQHSPYLLPTCTFPLSLLPAVVVMLLEGPSTIELVFSVSLPSVRGHEETTCKYLIQSE